MTDNKSNPDPEFREAVKHITPLKHNRIRPKGKKQHPVPRQSLADEANVLQESISDIPLNVDIESGEQLQFYQPGIKKTTFRRLKRGDFVVQGVLDLHGLTVAEAKQALISFLLSSRQQHKQCVRIIHGKGLRSPQNKGRIKHQVNIWLRQRNEVLAFCSARNFDGGDGALYVLLKKT